MGRNIVLLADGTGNSAAKAFKTNVWRLYQALDLGSGNQVAVFSDGVGTSGFRPFEIVGMALGFGVKRRVLALYRFLCLNYREGDDIYAFGFSRGAFTIRVLVGLVTREGLVAFSSQEELRRNALAAYRAYRKKAFPAGHFWVTGSRALRDRVVGWWNRLTGSRSYETVRPLAREVRIKFLGVWDSVAAYGLPVDELTKAVDRWVWPMTFARVDLLPSVDRARQAFSIDDERRTFFPIRWNEGGADPAAKEGEPPRLLQVWFAGAHANVGGGYPDDRLAHVPLCWMIGEAAESGLVFKPEIVADYWDNASASGRAYDPRSNLGIFYRYHPRAAGDLMGGAMPVVDASVLLRLASSDAYAPIALPEAVDVLTPLGERLRFDGRTETVRQITRISKPVDKLPLPADRQRDLEAMESKLRDVMRQLQQPQGGVPRSARVDILHDTIWWRRGLYYVTLLVAALLAAYPLFAGYVTFSSIDQVDAASNVVLGPILGFAQGLLPGFAAPWLETASRYPTVAILIGAALAVCFLLNNVLRTRIHDRAQAVWNAVENKGSGGPAGREEAHRRMAWGWLVAFGLAAAVAFALGSNKTAALVLAAAAAACAGALVLLRRRQDKPEQSNGGSLLGLARWVRTLPLSLKLYLLLKETILPALFLIIASWLILGVVNKTLFEIANSAGAICPAAPANGPDDREVLGEQAGFPTNDPCWNTGLRVKKGVRYRVCLTVQSEWKDARYVAGTRGFAASAHGTIPALLFYPATPFKRWWREAWFQPIARVGQIGNDEYVLRPVEPGSAPACEGSKQLAAELVPNRSGPLYLYVNDAAPALAWLYGVFYWNNQGSATISVERWWNWRGAGGTGQRNLAPGG